MLIIVVVFLIVMILFSVGTTLLSTPSDIAVIVGFIVMLLIPKIIFLTYKFIKKRYK